MHKKKQHFVFGMPSEAICTKVSKYPAHFFATDLNFNVLAMNSMQEKLFGDAICASVIGIPIFELYSKIASNIETQNVVDIILANNHVAMQSSIPQMFHEKAFGNLECLSIKGPLLDARNQLVGTGGIAFYFHQIALKDVIGLTKELFSLSSVTGLIQNRYIAKIDLLQKLTYRELECVYNLARGNTYKEIAKKFNIGYRTVETHITNIKSKLGCKSRSAIVEAVFETKKSSSE